MSWFNEHQRVWRAALLMLLPGAMLGPWVFDSIHVPAEYPCHAPIVRLEGDFCGVPLSGIAVFSWIVLGLIGMVTQPITGTIVFADWARALLFAGLVLLLFAAPLSSLLLLISGGGRRRWQVSHIAMWSLTLVIMGLLIALPRYPRLIWELWGIWLYAALAAGTLTLEALTLAARSLPSPGQPTAPEI